MNLWSPRPPTPIKAEPQISLPLCVPLGHSVYPPGLWVISFVFSKFPDGCCWGASCNLNKKHKCWSSHSISSGREMSVGGLPQVVRAQANVPRHSQLLASLMTLWESHKQLLKTSTQVHSAKKSFHKWDHTLQSPSQLALLMKGFYAPQTFIILFWILQNPLYISRTFTFCLLSVICAVTPFGLGFVSVLYIIKVCCSVIVDLEKTEPSILWWQENLLTF